MRCENICISTYRCIKRSERIKIVCNSISQCYMYCLWEQFGLVDDKRELSLNGMLTFFQRIPAYRAEVEKAISECKGIGNYLGICCAFSFSFISSIDCVSSKPAIHSRLVLALQAFSSISRAFP